MTLRWILLSSVAWILIRGEMFADELPAIVAHIAAHREPSVTASVPWDQYSGDLRRLPIGVFDSGIGGLTVLEAILKLDEHDNNTGKPGADGVPDFAGERFIYLGDQANMPYGNYSSAGRVDFLRELILRDALFLLGDRYWSADPAGLPRRDKPAVKAIVIACNTATAYGLDDIRTALEKWSVPVLVVGVVEAGGRGVIDAMRSDPTAGAAAVLATVGTCDSGAYPKAIARLAGRQGLQTPVVCQQGSVGLAGAIEGNHAFIATAQNRADGSAAADYQGPSQANPWAKLKPELREAYGFNTAELIGDPADLASVRLNSVDNYIRYDVTTLVDEYRRNGGLQPITTVVLGCTHYPLATAGIDAAFQRLREFRNAQGGQPYRSLIAEKLKFVDPGQYTAKELFRGLFLRRQLLNLATASVAKRDEFYVTVANPSLPIEKRTAAGGLNAAYKYTRLPGDFSRNDVRVVPISTNADALAASLLWRAKLKLVAERMQTRK